MEFIQKIIDFLNWYMQTELPEDTLVAIGKIFTSCGYWLYWLAEKYIEVFGGK